MNIWSEIRTDFEDEEEGKIYIDGFLTPDDNEEGKVIAKIDKKTHEVLYLDDRARTDAYAQEIINAVIKFENDIKTQEISNKIIKDLS